MNASKADLRVVGLAVCFAWGCSQGPEPSSDAPLSAEQALDAQRVLGLESAQAWSASGRGAHVARLDEPNALGIAVTERTTLTSTPFRFAKTPNVVEFSLASPKSSASEQAGGFVAAYLSCVDRQVARGLVGTMPLGSSAGSWDSIRLPVPESLQTALAGGCEQLQVEIVIEPGKTFGKYLLAQLELRAHTLRIAVDDKPLCGLSGSWPDAVELPDGYLDYQAWVATPLMRAEFPLLEQALQPYESAVLGLTTDHARKQIGIVADRHDIKKGGLLADLQASDIALPLRVQPACKPSKAVREVRQYLLSLPTSPETPIFMAFTDPARGQFTVTVDPETPPTSLELDSLGRVRAAND